MAAEARGWSRRATPIGEVQLQLLKDKLVRLQQSEPTTMLLELFEKKVLDNADFHADNDACIRQWARALVSISAFVSRWATNMCVV